MARLRADCDHANTTASFHTGGAWGAAQAWFIALMGLVFDPEGLRASFECLIGRTAPGVEGIRKADYAVGRGGHDVGAHPMGGRGRHQRLCIGQPWSGENFLWGADALEEAEGNIGRGATARTHQGVQHLMQRVAAIGPPSPRSSKKAIRAGGAGATSSLSSQHSGKKLAVCRHFER